MNVPLKLTTADWKEIIEFPAVKKAWGTKDATLKEFTSQVEGVKFKYKSEWPGYVGDLYIIQGDFMTGDSLWIFTRHKGKLVQRYFRHKSNAGRKQLRI